MEISLNSINEELPAIVFAINQTMTLNSWSNVVNNTINIFSLEKVSNLS
jgi:hypothetical protein